VEALLKSMPNTFAAKHQLQRGAQSVEFRCQDPECVPGMGQIAALGHGFKRQSSLLDAGRKKVSGRAPQGMGRSFYLSANAADDRASSVGQHLRGRSQEDFDNFSQ
jgi:hypothetical protein